MTSHNISIRLNDEIPDEAKALDILRRWSENSSDQRNTITRGLLALEGIDPNDPTGINRVTEQLHNALSKVQELAATLRTTGLTPAQDQVTTEAENTISTALESAVKTGFKKSKRLTE
jgi:hypothetical protein